MFFHAYAFTQISVLDVAYAVACLENNQRRHCVCPNRHVAPTSNRFRHRSALKIIAEMRQVRKQFFSTHSVTCDVNSGRFFAASSTDSFSGGSVLLGCVIVLYVIVAMIWIWFSFIFALSPSQMFIQTKRNGMALRWFEAHLCVFPLFVLLFVLSCHN